MSGPLLGAAAEASATYASKNATGSGGAKRGVIIGFEAGYGQWPEEEASIFAVLRTTADEFWYAYPDDLVLL